MRKNTALRQDDSSLELLLLVWFYRLLMVLIMGCGLCWANALPLRPFSGEAAVALGIYAVLMVVMQGIYRACEIGQACVSELVMSQCLTNLVTSALVYFGTALYVHHLFSPVPLVVILALQTLLGCGWTILVNHRYFLNRIPLRAVVLYEEDADLIKLYQTPYFKSKYEVCKEIRHPSEDIEVLRAAFADCQCVFTIGVPATLTNGIAKLCLEMDVHGYFVPHLGHIIMAGAEYMSSFSIPMLKVRRAGSPSEYRALKRLFDICASLAGIIVTLPVMAVTALAIRLEDHGPVFYRQVRLTKNGKEFKILKFRSMSVNAEQDGVARLAGENDSRITKVGHFIRSCRIDELPQLFNILVGDMSVVGPRPERPEIAAQYQQELPEFALRLQVKAGLTGLAQIYGRYNTEPYNKLQMDLLYINEMSFIKDLQLILATIKILFIKESTQGVASG